MSIKLYTVHKANRLDNCADFVFMCPGCGHAHGVYTVHPNDIGAKWNFDGNMEKPTITPSILSRWKQYGEEQERICHLFVKNGNIEFLNDCTHELRGQTVEMKEIEL